MQKFGFVFPGQGSQKAGMLSELAAVYPSVPETFAQASDVLGTDLWQITQENPDGLLDQTHFTQPALLAASVAIWRIWMDKKAPLPAMLAGHSLGEYSALVCAGVLGFDDAIALVHKRGQYMQTAVPAGTGGMAAIIGMDDSRIDEICRSVAGEGVVAAANFNSPGQTVIA
ncbi:MAG: ACP S-malonyltransferase, partial [Pseudohongiella sp.]